MDGLEAFVAVYTEELSRAVQSFPKEYGFPSKMVPQVVARMRIAIQRRSYNKDGRAFKQTCKKLGIPYTYAAINAFTSQQLPEEGV